MGLIEKLSVAAAASSSMDATEPAIGRPFYRFIPGADDNGQERINMTDERNWAGLNIELVSKVVEFLLHSDVTDYMRLREIKPWRGAAPKLIGMNPRFFPRHWKMLKAQGGEVRFMNVLTGASMSIQIPQDHGRVVASADGCLLLASPSGQGILKLCLLNPVNRAGANLPSLLDFTRLISHEYKAAGIIYDVDAQGQADASPTVMLLFSVWSIDMVMYAKPGDLLWQWQFFDQDDHPSFDGKGGLSLGGRFYVPTLTGDVLRLELQPQPHFVYAARNPGTHNCSCAGCSHLRVRSYLTPSTDAGMLLVRLFKNQAGRTVASHVFKVNLTEGTLTILKHQKDTAHPSIFLPWLTLRTALRSE